MIPCRVRVQAGLGRDLTESPTRLAMNRVQETKSAEVSETAMIPDSSSHVFPLYRFGAKFVWSSYLRISSTISGIAAE